MMGVFEGVLGVTWSGGRVLDLSGGSVLVRMCCKLCLGSGLSGFGDKVGCPFVFASDFPSTFRPRIRVSGERVSGPVPSLAGRASKMVAVVAMS